MRFVFSVALATIFFSSSSFADAIDPADVELRWMNGPDRDSTYVMLDNYNSVHVWEFFGNHCGPCNDNAPKVKALYELYVGRAENDPRYERVQFVDVSSSSDDREYASWIRKFSPEFPILKDNRRIVSRELDQTGRIPQTWVTDCTGQLVGWTRGVWDRRDVSNLKSYIEEALETECAEP